MSNDHFSKEFLFLRDKLERIAKLLTSQERSDIIEASFMIGCLHNVCHQNAMILKEDPPENA